MRDVAKCLGTGCPFAQSCLRFTSVAMDWQVWLGHVPYSEATKDCKFYLSEEGSR
jgi:hypothetical protein